METIKDIIAEMRTLVKPGDTVEHTFELLNNYADRIEAAAKVLESDRDNWRKQALAEDERANELSVTKCNQLESVTNCNGFGNAAKIRESLEDSNGLLEELALIGEWGESARGQIAENKAALSASPRNCDLYKSEPEAFQAYLSAMENSTKETYVYWGLWLFAEANESFNK